MPVFLPNFLWRNEHVCNSIKLNGYQCFQLNRALLVWLPVLQTQIKNRELRKSWNETVTCKMSHFLHESCDSDSAWITWFLYFPSHNSDSAWVRLFRFCLSCMIQILCWVTWLKFCPNHTTELLPESHYSDSILPKSHNSDSKSDDSNESVIQNLPRSHNSDSACHIIWFLFIRVTRLNFSLNRMIRVS